MLKAITALSEQYRSDRIRAILERLRADPEVGEALARLIYGLEHSDAESHESLVWETYTDRLAYLIVRAGAKL